MERRIQLPNGRVYNVSEEVLLQEVFELIEFGNKCKLDMNSNKTEKRLNEEYLNFQEQVETLINDDDFFQKLLILSRAINRMEILKRLKEEKISINVFNNKYGQKYLKGKSAVPEYYYENGKKKVKYKTISQHIGKLDDFKGGKNDEEVQEKSRMELLDKALKIVKEKYDDRD